MNLLRNIFGTRTLSFLRQNGQNALYNLTNDNNQPNAPVTGTSGLSTLSPAATGNIYSRFSPSSILNRFWNDSISTPATTETNLVADRPLTTTKSATTDIIHIPQSHDGQYGAPKISPRTLEVCRQMQNKLTIVYRCKLCNTRNSKQVNANAYRSGVVILQCDGCAMNHVIIDHLGWFADTRGKSFQDVIDDHSRKGKPIKVIRINENDELI